MAIILHAENVTKDYGHEKVVKGITMDVQENSFSVILGQSDSGKSPCLIFYQGRFGLRAARYNIMGMM